MSAYAKVIAGVLAVSGLSVAVSSDDPISLDGMGAMMADMRDSAAEPVTMQKVAPLPPAPQLAAREESCPNEAKDARALKVSVADLQFAFAPEGLEAAVAQVAAMQVQVAAQRDHIRAIALSSQDITLKAVQAARLNIREELADAEPVLAQRIELALLRAEKGLRPKRP